MRLSIPVVGLALLLAPFQAFAAVPSLYAQQFESHEVTDSDFLAKVVAAKDKQVAVHFGLTTARFYFEGDAKDVVLKTVPSDAKAYESLLRKNGGILLHETSDFFDDLFLAASLSSTILTILATVVIGFLLGMRVKKFFSSPFKRMSRRKSRTTFADVAGQTAAKRDLKEVLVALKTPQHFTRLGIRAPHGVLLDGDPGNGKTLLARAVAGEANVPFLHVSGSDFLEMIAGLGARRIRAAFKHAKNQRGGCILFIDEIDIIGGKRGNGSGSDVQAEREQILTALLTEMDGIERKGNVVVIGATNRPDMLDPALLRPGRMDRKIHVPHPTASERADILRLHAAKVPLGSDVDITELARLTVGASGAELRNLVNEAALTAARSSAKTVDMDDFIHAHETGLMGEPRPHDAVRDSERRLTAFHEAGHAIAAMRSPGADPVFKVTITPRGRSLGMVMMLPKHDRAMMTREKLESDLVIALAGRAAEQLIYGDTLVTTGAAQDIQHASSIARTMGGKLGMFEELGMGAFFDDQGRELCSPTRMAQLDAAVERRLRDAFDKASTLLQREKAGLMALADALLEKDTLSGPKALSIIDIAARSSQAVNEEGFAHAAE